MDAGDATQGMPLASLTQGEDIITLMNLAGYDVMAAGNHEFDFGAEQLLANAELADFPILAANVYRDGQPLLEGTSKGGSGCHTIVERDGVQVGFFGLTTTETATSTTPSGIAGLEFLDEVETAKKEIDELEEEGADVIIAICHMGDLAVSPCTSADLAKALSEDPGYSGKLDAIIDGHSHTVEDLTVGDTLIVQTGSSMAAVGKLTLTIDGNDQVRADSEMLNAAALAEQSVTADPEVTAKLEEISASQSVLLEEEIGTLDTTLWAGWIGSIGPVRLQETNFGNLVTDAFREAGEAFLETAAPEEERKLPVVAVENGGGIREAISNGTVMVGDLVAAFPFSNTLYMKKVTPAVLYEIMELSAQYMDGQDPETGMLLQGYIDGSFLQVSGFTVEFDTGAEKGSRVVSITLDGQETPLDRKDDSTQLLLVSNNYIMEGGSDYAVLASLPKYGEAGGELETIRAYLETCMAEGTMDRYASAGSRLLLRGDGYKPAEYIAYITVADENGQPMAGKALSYRVDGGERINGVTDENGRMALTLPDGPHGVRLSDSQNEVYVDNYSGLGLQEDDLRTFPALTFLSDGSCDPVATPMPSPSPSVTEEPSITPSITAVPEPSEAGKPGETVTAKPTASPAPLTPDQVKSPDTGDSRNTAFWAAAASAAAAAGIGLAWLSARSRRKTV